MDERDLLYYTLRGAHALNRAPKLQLARDLIGLQAQFSRNPEYALRLRASDYSPDWSEGLIKIWAQRGTIHVIREDELSLFLSAADVPEAFVDGAWAISSASQNRWAPFIQDQIRAGNDARDGLKAACLRAGMDEKLLDRIFHGWGGLIKEMAWRGQLAIVPGTEKRYLIPKPFERIPRDEAREALIHRYFCTFGPATIADCRYFFGWKAREMETPLRRALESLACTRIGSADYFHSPGLPPADAIPDCVPLPGFDQTILAYRDRSRQMPPDHARRVTNIAGIVFPAAVVRGRIRAIWKNDRERILVSPLEKLYKKDERAIEHAFKREFGAKEVAFAPINAN